MFRSFSKATLSYWKEVTGQYWYKVLVWVRNVCYRYWLMVVTIEWILSNFLKLFIISSHKVHCLKLVSLNGVFFIQWYLKKWVMSVMDFCFKNPGTKARNLDYVLWLSMIMLVLMILSRIYLSRLPSSSRDIFQHPNQNL